MYFLTDNPDFEIIDFVCAIPLIPPNDMAVFPIRNFCIIEIWDVSISPSPVVISKEDIKAMFIAAGKNKC